eukprot:Rmarinus@m.12516
MGYTADATGHSPRTSCGAMRRLSRVARSLRRHHSPPEWILGKWSLLHHHLYLGAQRRNSEECYGSGMTNLDPFLCALRLLLRRPCAYRHLPKNIPSPAGQ